MVRSEDVKELIKMVRELSDYCHEMDMLTGFNKYKKPFNYDKLSFIRRKIEDDLMNETKSVS